MAEYIIIRIVPPKSVDPITFEGYLSASGGLTITAYPVDFDTVGNDALPAPIGSATYVATPPPGGWIPTPPGGSSPKFISQHLPDYSAVAPNSIVQQVDLVPNFPSLGDFQLQSVATAIIAVQSPMQIENISLQLSWGAAAPMPITPDYYNIPLYNGAEPNLAAWNPNLSSFVRVSDPWAQIPTTSLVLELTPPTSGAGVQLPSDGSAPVFASLLQAMLTTLGKDPGAFPAAELGQLTPAQCQNLAYEILWAQQPPPPPPPNGDALEDLYTYPTNSGSLLNGTNPNNLESDRRQFEAQLQSYYQITDATADRLSKYVYSVAAAVACEQASLAASQALLSFPANPAQPGAAMTQPQIIFTGIQGLAPGLSFGVPAGYFYALASAMPTTIDTAQRFQMATAAPIQNNLDALTSAINAQTIGDGETFVTGAGSINAAQAARRMDALSVPNGSTTPLAPLGAFSLLTNASSPAGDTLMFSATDVVGGGLTANDGVTVTGGLTVSGAGLAAGAKVVAAPSETTVTVAPAFASEIPASTGIVFTPTNPPQMDALIGAWLAHPATPTTGISSQVYLPSSDQAVLWPKLASNQPHAFLNLVLCAATQGFVLPPPFSKALGSEIAVWMVKAPVSQPQTVAGLLNVTTQEWTALFQANPTWLPGQQGDPNARIAAFLQTLKKYLSPPNAGPVSVLNLATSSATPDNSTILHFASTTGVAVGMSIKSTSTAFIQPGTIVKTVSPAQIVMNNVTNGGVIPFGTNIVFTPNVQAATASPLPSLPQPPTDWIGKILNAYDAAFKFGDGIALPNPALQAAAAAVFPGDVEARRWAFDAFVTIDALCRTIGKMVPPVVSPGLSFSIFEALYARGFVSPASVTEMAGGDFQQALIGTIAYDYAAAIYAAASTLAPPAPTPGAPGSFHPINLDGSLVNCVPPACRSPLGPIAYLHEMLQVSEDSTCQKPLNPKAVKTLGAALAGRRGPLGDLSASCANLETPLPLIDVVNENLEFMGSNLGTAHGVVFDTATDTLNGFALCKDGPCTDDGDDKDCHPPAEIFSALPQHSSPVTRTLASGAIDPTIYDRLKTDFSSCELPYSQPLDVNRSYERRLGSCRAEEMRAFRKCITEFVLDPAGEPSGFQPHLWRYPLRIEIAVEYLGLTPEEYSLLFQGAPDRPCAGAVDRDPVLGNVQTEAVQAWRLYGFADAGEGDAWVQTVVHLPQFLARTCLSYCEFLELWKSGFVPFYSSGDERIRDFPECEPCCLDAYRIAFPGERDAAAAGLIKLAVFVRLWRILKRECCDGYSFDELRDICDVLQLFKGGALNPDFIRQLAALKLLCDHFGLPLQDRADPPAPGATGADRTALLALWEQPTAAKMAWAIDRLAEQIEHHALHHHHCERREPEFMKILVANLDPLSRLAGFDTASAAAGWRAAPTHTLRFIEILSKIYASPFSVGELLFLFTAEDHLDDDDPFPMPTGNDGSDSPLDLPEESHANSLWRLRDKLLAIELRGADDDSLSWRQVEAELQSTFGFNAVDVRIFGAHFFPATLRSSGLQVNDNDTRFFSALAAAATTPQTWNTPSDGPFQYDPASQRLSTHVPLSEEALLETLKHAHDLSVEERTALQDLFYQPRAMLAGFALLFTDFHGAVARLVAERDEAERWAFFRRQFMLCIARCRVIAEHLEAHVAAATGRESPAGAAPAMMILRELLADDNGIAGTPPPSWENDDGGHGPVVWTKPSGGAFAALLALTGTGLHAEIADAAGTTVWRDVSGTLSTFGEARNRANCPVPTIVPALDAQLTPQQMQLVSVHNGLLMKDASDEWLGGAQGFAVTWTGALLVGAEGPYEFFAGAPTPDGECPDVKAVEEQQWRVTLSRGQREWVLLAHRWPGEATRDVATLSLKRGAYEIKAELRRPTPEFEADRETRRQITGFEIKYCGPDSDDRRIALPHNRLFFVANDSPLGAGIVTLGAGAGAYLNRLYVGSLRGARGTYQRAFKTMLVVHRFGLSARRREDGASELEYMLTQKQKFAGAAYYPSGGVYVKHAADFDFNYLPVVDGFHSPEHDSRAHPSLQRTQAMFDWWERLYDYTGVRKAVHRRCGRELWRLFDEAFDKQPAEPAGLLRHMGADSRYWPLDLHYFQGQHAPIYAVTADDLEDDRWVVRAWWANEWLRALERVFAVKDISKARPDLWASDDPGALVADETVAGNANLIAFVCGSAFDDGAPRRYDEVRRLDDGVRERSRRALLAYLCRANRVALPWPGGGFATRPGDLSDLLLVDVEAGLSERLSRIDEAINAAQSFIRRARVGLEPQWHVSREFARLWDCDFVSFHVWQACKRRQLYKEDWIAWDEVEKAHGIEAFAFLESRLRNGELSAPKPGGLVWWPNGHVPIHETLERLQRAEVSQIQAITPPREGLGLLGAPEKNAQPSWLSPVGSAAQPPTEETAKGIIAPQSEPNAGLPLWMQVAVRLGATFIRVAAAGTPPAGSSFAPHEGSGKGCVSCCAECGCEHEAHVDEYYFWLIAGAEYGPPSVPQGFTPIEPDDGYQFGYQDDFYASTQQEAAYWWDPTQLPRLLDWQASPTVRLAWCRVHNGGFQQPRRSNDGVLVTSADADLQFLGRQGDSLYFQITKAAPPPAGYADTSPPGFRYDLAFDEAVTLPLPAKPAPASTFFNGSLAAYPFFAFVAPGHRLFPLSPYAPAIVVARHLRAHCQFEAALRWYRLAFDPVNDDCTWVTCDDEAMQVATQGACCDSTAVDCKKAEDRSIILEYLDTLKEWGDALVRGGNSPEAMQQARVAFSAAQRILGKRPDTTLARYPETVQTVGTFRPDLPPLNPRLLGLYDVIHDRLRAVHENIDAHRLRLGLSRMSESYFGDDPTRDGWRSAADCCAPEGDWCQLPSPYRFTFLIQKAQEYATRAQELGAALLAAFEKGDAEFLAALRGQFEGELLAMGLDAKKDQWRDADWQVEALQKTKAASQANLTYYTALIQNGLIADEIGYQDLTGVSMGLRTASTIVEAIGEAMNGAGNYFDGVAGFGGTPLLYQQLPIGQPIGSALAGAARALNTLAEIAGSTAGLLLTEAGWQRRNDEWVHQTQVLGIEIQQIERQILGAQRRRDQMLIELNSHQRQTEQAFETQNFLRDKFTAHDLYLFMQHETSALYFQTYDLATYVARQAEHAYNLERGHTARRFLPGHAWDQRREGLLAAERLSASLRAMEKSYLDENVRERELTENISLRLNFPAQFLQLKTTGLCEIDIPEWMFDLHYPGHYLRRIKSVTLTIPCVAGPYTGVHCRLTLLANITRVNPLLAAPAHRCCCPEKSCCCRGEQAYAGYALCADDPRMVKLYGAREAIATSTGQNDSGLFELSFNDPRYLPFEFMGAVSRWRIEMPKENNYFDFESLTDTVLRLNYTAREGGEALERAARSSTRGRTPGNGWTLFDVRHDFPDAWELFQRSCGIETPHHTLKLRLSRRHFPFLPGSPEIRIRKLAVLFEAEEGREHDCAELATCPCREDLRDARHVLQLVDDSGDGDRGDPLLIRCASSHGDDGLYDGMADVHPRPFRRDKDCWEFSLRFPRSVGVVTKVYILCGFERPTDCARGSA